VGAAAVLAALLLAPSLVNDLRGKAVPSRLGTDGPIVSEEALARLERNLTREQAARYLAEAQDVLVNVAASPRDCDRSQERVDVEAESRRSRALLAKGALLASPDEQSLRSARPVLEDVEQMLREVAGLEACVRAQDLDRLRQRIERRQLLMKMQLTQRELLG
jgi:hypothetical protein